MEGHKASQSYRLTTKHCETTGNLVDERSYDYFKSKPDIPKNGFKEANIIFA